MNKYEFDWNELAFASKKPLREARAVFIAAPRDTSLARFKQLIKEYLRATNIVLGLAKEKYILGFEDQSQFKTLPKTKVLPVIMQVNNSASKHKIITLEYFQTELSYIFEKVDFKEVILVNGSWKKSFHLTPPFYELAKKGIVPKYVSAFADEDEARSYAADFKPAKFTKKGLLTDLEMLELAKISSNNSFDYSGQVGLAVGKKTGQKYQLLTTEYNHVVPYETYALLNGNTREANMCPPSDRNYYDTIHAETALILKAQKAKLDLRGQTLFINVLPCPACARLLAMSDISEVVYELDHSAGYAVKMLETAGKTVRRIVA